MYVFFNLKMKHTQKNNNNTDLQYMEVRGKGNLK